MFLATNFFSLLKDCLTESYAEMIRMDAYGYFPKISFAASSPFLPSGSL